MTENPSVIMSLVFDDERSRNTLATVSDERGVSLFAIEDHMKDLDAALLEGAELTRGINDLLIEEEAS